MVNFRTDVLRLKPDPEGWSREVMLQELVKRGKAFLDSGATCAFFWSGAAGGRNQQRGGEASGERV